MTTITATKEMPKIAGMAELYFERDAKIERRERTITLPKQRRSEFYSLRRGKQFLFVPEETARADSKGNPSGKNVWFGGTDENPFLVELLWPAYEVLQQKGSRGFFSALKPRVITMLERRFKVRCRRQGDIWAVPVPYSREEINFQSRMFGAYQHIGWFGPTWRQDWSVFGTRHRITGYISYRTEVTVDDREIVETVTYAEGTIIAPDHQPMLLREIHILAQTRLLADSVYAD